MTTLLPPRFWEHVTVEPLVFVFTFGQFLSFPITSALMYHKSCLTKYNESFCKAMDNRTFQKEHPDHQDVIQDAASYWTMLNQVALALPNTFVVFFFMASWGDKVNRKIPILLPCVGSLLCNAINFLCSRFISWHVGILLVGSLLNSFLGLYSTLLMGVYSYVVHIASQEHKTVRVGIVQSMSFLAGGVSVFVSGLIRREVGFQGVYAIVLALTVVSIIYGIAFIKSVKPPKQKTSGDKTFFQTWGKEPVQEMISFVKKPREGDRTLFIWLYIVLLNLMILGVSGEYDILYLFLRRVPRSFNSIDYGYFRGAENFSRSLALILLLPILKKVFHWRDSTILILGIVFKGIQFCLLGFSRTHTMVFLVLIFATLQGFPVAALRSGISKLVDPSEHGRMFGVVAVTEGLVSLAASFFFNGLYPQTLKVFDGIMFEFIACLSVFATMIVIFLRWKNADRINTNESGNMATQEDSSYEEIKDAKC